MRCIFIIHLLFQLRLLRPMIEKLGQVSRLVQVLVDGPEKRSNQTRTGTECASCSYFRTPCWLLRAVPGLNSPLLSATAQKAARPVVVASIAKDEFGLSLGGFVIGGNESPGGATLTEHAMHSWRRCKPKEARPAAFTFAT